MEKPLRNFFRLVVKSLPLNISFLHCNCNSLTSTLIIVYPSMYALIISSLRSSLRKFLLASFLSCVIISLANLYIF